MLQLQVIGNLGVDAELKTENGREYVQFRVAHSEKFTNRHQQVEKRTTWVTCFMEGNGGKLLPYLKQGAKVYVSGAMSLRVYTSEKARGYVAGASVNVRSIELCGGTTDAVPRELLTTDGEVVQVHKAFYTADNRLFNSQLHDGNMINYNVNENGFIYEQHSPNP